MLKEESRGGGFLTPLLWEASRDGGSFSVMWTPARTKKYPWPQTQGQMWAKTTTLLINKPVINNSDKVDAYYTQDKWRINFCFINSLYILEQLAGDLQEAEIVLAVRLSTSWSYTVTDSSLGRHTLLQTYFGGPVGDLPPDHEPLDKGPRDDEGPVDLELQPPGHISEGLQLLHVLADALQVVVAEVVLRVEQLEHVLQQPGPEVVQHLLQVDVAARVVALQLGEQVLEHARFLQVELLVSAREHLVQRLLCVVQELQEKLCKEGRDIRKTA